MINENSSTCPQCHSTIMGRVEGDTFILACRKCNWSVATSYFSMISKDFSKYKIFIDPKIDIENRNAIKTVSSMLGTNLVDLAKLIKSKEPLIVNTNALNARECLEQLKSAKVKFDVTPPFPWKLRDGTEV